MNFLVRKNCNRRDEISSKEKLEFWITGIDEIRGNIMKGFDKCSCNMDNRKHLHRKCDKVRQALVCFFILFGGAMGLRDVKIKVPEMVRSGDSALLSCHYDLEGAPLYSIQWYFEEKEFYRYTGRQEKAEHREPRQNVFKVDDVEVDISKSNMHDVTLTNVSRNQRGLYKCEVTAEISYEVQIARAMMDVAEVPKNSPVLTTERPRLPSGETLRANCTSGASRPAPRITWTLNGRSLDNATMDFTIRSNTVTSMSGETALSQLQLKLLDGMFNNGMLQLRCFAEIPHVYRAKAEIAIAEDTPLIASITGDASPHSHHSSGGGTVSKSSGVCLTTMFLILSLTAR